MTRFPEAFADTWGAKLINIVNGDDVRQSRSQRLLQRAADAAGSSDKNIPKRSGILAFYWPLLWSTGFFLGPFFALLGYKLNLPKARVPAEFGPGGKPDHLGKTTGSMNYF